MSDERKLGVCEQDRRRLAGMTDEQRCEESYRDARRHMLRTGRRAPAYTDYRQRWFELHANGGQA